MFGLHQRAAHRWLAVASVTWPMFLLSSCKSVSGPCIHTYRSPIVEVESAFVIGTNEPVTELVIHGVTLDGDSVELRNLATPPAHGVVLRDDVLVCTIPCGFGIQAGHYSILLEGGGQPTRFIDVDARYRVFHGGCPSYNDGGTAITVDLGVR
jgi:hypothetical protein